MKKFLLLVSFLAASVLPAQAATDVQVVIGSATWSGVTVTTGTTIRIDNLIQGTTVTIPGTRIGIEINNLDATNSIFYAYTTNFTTHTADTAALNSFGFEIKAGELRFIGLLRQVQVHAKGADAAGASGINTRIETYHKE